MRDAPGKKIDSIPMPGRTNYIRNPRYIKHDGVFNVSA